MKEFQLSSPKERTAGIAFSGVMVVCFGVLLFALRSNIGLLIFCALCALLLTVLLGFYVVSVLKAACIWDPEKKTLEVKGFPTYTLDLSRAVLLQTLPRRSGHATVRCLVFTDAEENILATIPTLFTSRQGLLAEPFAKEMAKEMGIAFKQNIPEWEYDKEKYQEHQKQVAEEERAASRARRQARIERLMKKYKK